VTRVEVPTRSAGSDLAAGGGRSERYKSSSCSRSTASSLRTASIIASCTRPTSPV